MNIASLFNLAGPDLIIILLIVLLLFGAKKLPELARGMGQAVREFTKAKDEFEREVTRPPEPPAPTAKLDHPPTDVAQDAHHDANHDEHSAQTQEVPQTRVI
ncbi:MAG: twin-arginine translocase TatA/TatE family subunit [Chthoniobacter sp.]